MSARISRLVRRTGEFDVKGPRSSRRQCKSSYSTVRPSPFLAGLQRKRAVESAWEGFDRGHSALSAEAAPNSSSIILKPQCLSLKPNTAPRVDSELCRHYLPETASVNLSTTAPKHGLQVPPNTPNASQYEMKRSCDPECTDDHMSDYPTDSRLLSNSSYGQCLKAPGYPDNVLEHSCTSARSSSNSTSDLCSLSFGLSTTRTNSTSIQRFSQPDSPTLDIRDQGLASYNDERSYFLSPRLPADADDWFSHENGHYLQPATVSAFITEKKPDLSLALNPSLFETQCYSLPEAEHGSTLTLKPGAHTFSEPANLNPIFQRNDDSSHDHMTTLLEFFDDHGYLGEMIH